MADLTFTLNTGHKIPAIGYGTWQAAPGEVAEGVYHALKSGYRLIDAAYCYGNETEVGQGLARAFKEGIVKREDIFVVTKVWTTYNTRVALGLQKSLDALGLDYVDLYLLHWPLLMNPEGNDDKFPKLPNGERDIIREGYHHTDTWKQLTALDKTKARAVGVCNYSKRYLEELLAAGGTVPAVNQIENHPALPQNDIVGFCKEKGIHIMAYSPLGSTGGPLFKEEKVIKVAQKHGVDPAAVLLSWHIPRGTTVLAKSVTPARIEANLKLVKLDDEDIKLLNGYGEELEKTGKVQRFVYPPFGVDFGFPDKS
ncbi:Aldo/keto reductase [Cryphonectria parasitica EP155]|uniref:Aldo/keto reductase n=1 Tax=Cryphonectria parasitica (strain ATCC 38755 / EP155) TaxID=660469 RepID=A0A9P4XSJ4_CRYP1|nr:Aldo/keto reductase [Cryphonectria parasitica EP155]KAF3759945.1 Aldo/keto reductase [Cryphonectria parasitica EP155]